MLFRGRLTIKSKQMNKRIKSILRCYASGMGIKETSDTFHASLNTVRKYVRLFLSSGKSIDQLLSLSDEQLHELFGSGDSRRREPSSRRVELEALLPGYVSRLTRKVMSVRKLFKEYHAEYPDGLQLSSFKRAVREYKFHVKVVGHVEHHSAVHDGGHFPFHAPCAGMGLPCPSRHSTAYQECGISLQGLP